MIKTQEFRTRTLLRKKENVSLTDKWIVGEDIGYSGVKVYCANGYSCFPAYASKLKSDFVAEPTDNFICYRDDVTGEEWLVGEVAQNRISTAETNDSEQVLFGRERYFTPMYKVIAAVGIALGMTSNQYGSPQGKELFLQTGLPPAYLKTDTELIKEALAGEYKFSIKVGKMANYKKYEFELDTDHIFVMAQPKGTLSSVCMDNKAKFVPGGKKYLEKRTLIFDPGFGTLDVFPIFSGTLGETQTFDNLAMKEVFKRTSEKIYNEHGVSVSVAAMQKILQDGYVTKILRKEMKKKKVDFAELLEASSKEVCKEAVEQLLRMYNYFSEIDYLVITGGTGAAWSNYIKEMLSGMTEDGSLQIVNGNQNDEIPYLCANARGYYLTAYSQLKAKSLIESKTA